MADETQATKPTQSSSIRPKTLHLDSILNDIGQFGRYQQRTLFFVLFSTIVSAVHNSQFIFNAAKVEFRCKVPECESEPPKFEPGDWGKFALPKTGSKCDRYAPLGGTTCTPENFHTSETVKCNSWVYKSHDSIVAEFDLGCVEWKRTMIGTFRNIGIFLALGLTAFVSDNYGRRTAFLMNSVSAGVMGVIRTSSTSYVMYVILEFIEALLGAGLYSTGYLLATEMVGTNYRVLSGTIVTAFFSVGQIACALIAWAVPYWKTFTLIIYPPGILGIFYLCIIDESARWLISKDRKKEGAKIIHKIAIMNKKELSPSSTKLLSGHRLLKINSSNIIEEPKHESTFKEVITSKTILSRLVMCSFWWVTITFTYYGLSINSVSLAGNGYVNYILICLVEVPGSYISTITLDRYGRKAPMMTAFFICGFSLLIFPLIKNKGVMIALSMIGKLAISMVFAAVYIYTVELFPTNARHSLMNTCSMIGRFGSMAAPQAPLLMMFWEPLPYLIFGTMATTSGLLMMLSPETYRTRLPDTVAQAEALQNSGVTFSTDKNERNPEPTL